VRQKKTKRQKKDVFSKSEYLSRSIIRRQKKNINQQKPCLCGPKKEKYKYDMEAERKCGPKNTIVQMKEKKKKLIHKIETSYT
jgi:hypothetical protein